MVFDTLDKSLPSARKIGCAAELPAIVAIVQLILELASRENYQYGDLCHQQLATTSQTVLLMITCKMGEI